MPSLFTGIDIGKKTHHASFHIPTQKKDPVFAFANERVAFEALLTKMQEHASLNQCHVLVESTGHYGASLIQFLQEHVIIVYRISPKLRYGVNKNDTNDARMLALLLYQQIEQGVRPLEKSWHVRRLIPALPTARLLRGLVQHRLELSRAVSQRKNKLIAIEDELFPERAKILAKPYSQSALALLETFPSPQAVASATVDQLMATRPAGYPGPIALAKLQHLAAGTIGTKDINRQKSLILEQELLIIEFRLLQEHIERLDSEIEDALQGSREGQILASFTGIGPTLAPRLLAHIGNIANFETASELKAFLGWAPKGSQTGTSYDVESLDKKRNVPIRAVVFLITMNAVRYDPHWKDLYDRLIPLKCTWDGRKKEWKGKMKVVGQISGLIIKSIFNLLKRDHMLVAAHKHGELPPPELYDASKVGVKNDRHATPP